MTLSTIFAGAGVSLLAACLVHQGMNKYWNAPVMQRFHKAILDAWPEICRIRYDQSITFNFSKGSRSNGVEYINLDIIHEFCYKNDQNVQDRFFLHVFSDFRNINEPAQDGKAEGESTQGKDAKRFYFRKIHLSPGLLLEYDTIEKLHGKEYVNDLLANTECKNKLSFRQDVFSIEPNQRRGLSFEIHSEYELTDRLVWSFQEISEKVDVTINLLDDCICTPNDMFILTINHPLEAVILDKNKSLDKNGKIKFECPESKQNSGSKYNSDDKQSSDSQRSIGKQSKFKLWDTILPYQGFELSWNWNVNRVETP